MKKLLGILGTIAVVGSGISGIVGNNAPASEIKSKINYSQTNNLENLNRNKRENVNFNDYFFKHIQETNNYNIYYITFKKDNEIYLGTWTGAFILDLDNNEMKKIEGVPNTTVWTIAFNKNNNDTYFATEQGVYLLKSNENIAKKINGTEGSVRWIVIDSNNVGYFSIYGKGLFKWEDNVLTKYNNIHNNVHALGIDNEDNLYVGFWNINEKMCVIKKGETEPTPLEIPAQNIGFISFNKKDNSIYIGGTNNIYILKDLKINKIINCEGWVMSISVSLDNNEIFFTTHYNGNFIFYKKQNKIIKIEKITTENSRSVTVDKYNNIYFATHSENKGVYVLKNINYLEKNFKKDLDEKQTEINQLKTELEQTKQNLEEQVNNEKNKNNKLNQDLTTKQNENNQLKTELDQLKSKNNSDLAEITDLKNKLNDSNNQTKNLEKEKNDLIQENQDKLIKLNSEITDLKSKLNDANKKISILEKEIKQADELKDDIKKKLNTVIEEKNDLEKDLKDKEDEINKLSQEKNDLEKDLKDKEQKINSLINLNGKYFVKVTEYADTIKRLEEEINKNSDLAEILTESKQNYIDLKSENEKLIDENKIKITKISNEKNDLEKDLTTKQNEINKLSQEKNKLEDELKVKTEEIKTLEEKAKLYSLDKSELINKIIKQEIESWIKDDEIYNKEQEIKKLKIQLKQCQEKV